MAVDVHDYLDRLPNMLSEARASNTPKLCYSGLLLCYLELLVNKNPLILPLKKIHGCISSQVKISIQLSIYHTILIHLYQGKYPCYSGYFVVSSLLRLKKKNNTANFYNNV